MSVINTMLKDLDKRQQGHKVEEVVNAPLQYHGKPSSRLPWILLAIVTLLLVIGIGLNWQQLQQIKLQTQANQLDEQPLSTHQATQENIELTANNKPATQQSPAIEQAPSAAQAPSAGQEPSADDMPTVGQAPAANKQSIESDTAIAKQLSVIATTQPESVKQQPQTPSKPASIAENVTAEPKAAKVTVSAASSNQASAAPSSPTGGSMAIKEVRLTSEQLANKRLALGSEAENQGLQADAELYYNEALQLNNALHQARKQLAALYYGQGRMPLAIQVLNQGLTLYPKEYEYALLAAKVYQAAENYDLALDVLSRIPQQSAYLKQKLTLQSVMAQKAQQYELSADSYRQLARLEPQQARWWMGLAYALDAQQDYVSAKAAYQHALQQRGLSGEAVNYIETRLAQLGDIE
ncbi:MSHA biogenesis protein MshN [Shewanella waksmanii]|uniref:tetratricopeptide repeat protein n=1 Tax=Shewanella waksmanii TaxID=213783 RepID=UPI0037356DBB